MKVFPELTPAGILAEPVKVGFWRRQFASPTTTPRIVFDLIFGAVAPLLCFVFDPIVLRSGFAGPPMFPDYQSFVYLFSGAEILLLFLWLVLDPGFDFCNSLIGGALLFGGMFCIAVGIVLFPFSAFGLMFGIGVFGFTPFITGLVYLRQGYRALSVRRPQRVSPRQLPAIFAGALIIIVVSTLAAIEIRATTTEAVNQILQGDSDQALRAAHRLAPLRFAADAQLDRLVDAYGRAGSESRKQLIKRCYWEATGNDIQQRIVLRD